MIIVPLGRDEETWNGEYDMQIIAEAAEIKNAIKSMDDIGKKTPNDLNPGDAPMCFLYDDNGFSLVTSHEYYSASIRIESMQVIGSSDPKILQPWDGSSALASINVLGLANPSMLKTLVGRLPKKQKQVTLTLDEKRRRFAIASDGGEYSIDLTEPRRVVASYRGLGNSGTQKLASLEPDVFSWFSGTVSSLGKIVKPSVSKPGFSNVCMSAAPSAGGMLQISGNSDTDGYSFVYDTQVMCDNDFTSLIPKTFAEPFSSFFAPFVDEATIDMYADIDPATHKAGSLVFRNDRLALRLSCMVDDFPFQMLSRNVKASRQPYCSYRTKREELKEALSRITLFAKDDDAVTDVSILDGGSIELSERLSAVSRETPAHEVCSAGDLVDFPDNYPEIGTTVKTSVLASAVDLLPAKSDATIIISKARVNRAGREEPRRLTIAHDLGGFSLTAILLGIRGIDA